MKSFVIMMSAAAMLAGCVGGTPGSNTTTTENGRFLTGYEAIKRADYPVAERELALVLDREPNDPYANLAMGYVMQQTNRGAEARPFYDIALREGEDTYPNRHFVLSDKEYYSRPAEEDTISEMAERNIASLTSY